MSDIEVLDREGYVHSDLASRLYPNMTSYPGQLAFIPGMISPKQEIEVVRHKAVRASYQAERTSAHIQSGREKHADMVVGPGLMVRPTPDWDLLGPAFTPEARRDYSNQCRAWFNNWAYDTSLTQDAEGHYDFGGLRWQAYHNASGPEAETVGAILRDEDRMIRKGASWATYLNVIHPARLQTPPLFTGSEEQLGIFQGKQLDSDGAWEGLYILKKHPAEGGLNVQDYAFLPRVDGAGVPMAWHFYQKEMGGAQRGISDLVTVIGRVFNFDKAHEANLGAVVLDSLFALFVKSGADPKTVAERLAPDPRTGVSSFDKRAALYQAMRLRYGGQRVPVMADGDELVLQAANRAAQDPTAFFNIFLREFAAVTGTTFEQIANNWSDANYSAARAALLDLWRLIMRKRIRFSHVPSLCYSAVIDEAITARHRIILPKGAPPFEEMRQAYTRRTWMGPGMGQIDPEKEAKANEINLRIKATNRDIIWAERGLYYYDGFVQYGEELKEAEDLNFVLDQPLPGAVTAEDPAASEDDRSGNERRKSPAPAE